MQLNTLLLMVVGVLTILSGISIFAGSHKAGKKSSGMFLLAAFFAMIWTFTIAIFLSLKPENSDIAKIILILLYSSAPFMDTCLLAYVGWPYKSGKFLAAVMAAGAAFVTGALLYDPGNLYSSITLSNTGNSIQIVNGWFYWTYLVYLVLVNTAILWMLLKRVRKSRSAAQRNGFLIFLAGMSFTGIIALIFDAILPFWVRYDLIWIGPLAIGAVLLTYYYAVLRFRMISLSTLWLKCLSYGILICSAAIIYMIIFYIVFTALFKVPNPSTSIFVLNFIMILIVLLLLPVINELSAFLRSLIHTNQVDLPYIVKKLNGMTTNVNLNELSSFLADHMHFAYIGMVVDGKLHGSSALPISSTELKQITVLKSNENGSLWQNFTEPAAEIFSRTEIYAVAELRDAKGKPFGQLLVGKPLGKQNFERRDLIQLEMIINLVAAMIDTKAK